MSRDIVLEANGRVKVVFPSSLQWSILHLALDICPDIAEELLPSTEVDRVAADAMVAAIDRFQSGLDSRRHLLDGVYQHSRERSSGLVPAGVWTSGGSGGLKLHNDPSHVYMLTLGLGEFRLDKVELMPDGRGRLVGSRPLRLNEVLHCTEYGRITFRTVAPGDYIRPFLAHLRDTVSTFSGMTVVRHVE